MYLYYIKLIEVVIFILPSFLPLLTHNSWTMNVPGVYVRDKIHCPKNKNR